MSDKEPENLSEVFLGHADELLGSVLRELHFNMRKGKEKKKAAPIPVLALRLGASLTTYVRQLAGAQTMLAQLEAVEMNMDPEGLEPLDMGATLDDDDDPGDGDEAGGGDDDAGA